MTGRSSFSVEPEESALVRQGDEAFSVLKAEIVSCRLAPGASFSEANLSARFGLTRAAARAALARLAEQGLVSPVARHGYTVAPVTLQSIRELFQLRLILEPRAAAMATDRVSIQVLRELNKAPQLAHSADDRLAFVAANRAFHRAIAAAAGHSRLYGLLEALADEGERLVHLGLFGPGSDHSDRTAADQGHSAIIAAFETRDQTRVEQETFAHIDHAQGLALTRLMSGAASVPIA